MFKRQTSGSVVCPNCGRLVGVQDESCFHCGKRNPGLWGWAPLVNKLGRDLGFMEIVLVACSLIFVVSFAYSPRPMPERFSLGALFGLLSPQVDALYQFGAAGFIPTFIVGRWWTVLSAGWLHGGLLHIGMNMWCLWQLVPAVGHLFGVSRLVIIYTVSSIAGFLLTSYMGYLTVGRLGAPITVGASAALLGMCGALIRYGQRAGGTRALTQQIVQWVVIIFVIGFVVGVIDNWAHLGGLIGGYLAAWWLDPLHEERQGHRVAALACLVATVASLAMSLLRGPSWAEVVAMLGG